ncbi:glycoside hydrolase [Leptodontidium sp. 2 PMI_412]|nr:glycoside hydrolase [Leptodontidium sp. 2 PMI_412]
MTPNADGPGMQWFTAARLGMFIHWGLYSTPGHHEWLQTYQKIAPEVYEKYSKYFDPDLYDPVHWVKTAKAAGMKYMVLTTNHHEGFSMWDTKLGDFNCINTPL